MEKAYREGLWVGGSTRNSDSDTSRTVRCQLTDGWSSTGTGGGRGTETWEVDKGRDPMVDERK